MPPGNMLRQRRSKSTVARQPQTQADHYPLCGVKRGGKSFCQDRGTPL